MYQYAIGTFNTCSWGPTHRSLNDTGGDTSLEVSAFHITTPDLPNRRSSAFHLRALPGLRLSNQSLPTKIKRKQTLNLVSGILHSTCMVVYHLSIALLTISHQKIGVRRINWKVDSSATTVSYNSYQLNAQSTKI
jgi:hypothetical protein